jgi:cell surface protein SprA
MHAFGLLAAPSFDLGNPYEDEKDLSIAFNPSFLDTIPLSDRFDDYLNRSNGNPYDLKDPGIVEQKVEYDPETGQYIITETIGENYYTYPTYMTFSEYLEWRAKKQEQAYFNNLTGIDNEFITFSNIEDPIEQFDIRNDLIDRLFGGNEITVEPKGNIDITLGADYQKVLNPNLPINQQRRGGFDFDMDINMGLNAKIGEKLNLDFNYNTNATFSFENKFKLKFDSEAFSEDDIIKNIEAGDVSLPLNSSLIQGNQSLFGLKTELQFGRLFLTTVISQQRSEQENVTVQNGAQWQEFEVRADEYDENRHFLLSHYNRDAYAEALEALPQIQSLFRVTRAEVWVTSINNEYQDLRQIVAIADLGEFEKFTSPQVASKFRRPNAPSQLRDKLGNRIIPDNTANKIYETVLSLGESAREIRTIQATMTGPDFEMVSGKDFEQRRARKLSSNRYTLIPELGVISLDAQLRPDEVLAVAYEYTYNGKNYQVGEFSSDVPSFSGDTMSPRNQVIYVKMLKSSTQIIDIPMYDLMMKNVYSIGAYQASEEDFQFDIYYDDPGAGFKRYLPEPEPFNKPLLTAYGLDQLNFYGDPAPDGFFDFIPGITINTRTGKVMFPVLEPFGSDLQRPSGLNLPDDLFEKYKYQELYDASVFVAQEFQEKNRFVLKGSYKSSVSSEISLGSFNLPPNSVVVRSGGVTLKENVDYVVDYQIGRVRIINDAYISSGAPINVSFEDRTLFGFNRQSMLGLRADYHLNKKMNLGGTYMKLWERPFTQKVNYGDDPINNSIYGLDFAYSDEAPWLTKIVDGLPLLSTKEKSHIDFYVEGAVLKPGHSRAINVGDDEGGVVYIDDFEGSSTGILLASQINRWALASVPQNHPDFPEGNLNDDPAIGSNRALLNWYRIESNIPIDGSDPYQKFYRPDDIFPGSVFANNFVDFRTMDVTYYPDRIGPYNFDLPNGIQVGGTQISEGLEGCDGNSPTLKLKDPTTRWAGIMRAIDATNFEAANVQALEFWVLNPFIGADEDNDGEILFHIGNVSEDILKDGLAFYENAMPVTGDVIPIDETNLGQVPSLPPVIFAFSNENADRELQDVGLDGYNDDQELEKFDSYVNAIGAQYPLGCINESFVDPVTGSLDIAHDNYLWFDDPFYDAAGAELFERYRRYNGTQGNSPIVTNSSTFSNSFTSIPDAEDINQDGSSEKTESYYEYKVTLNNTGGFIDEGSASGFITDKVENPGGETWYRFKIPLKENTDKIGEINDFRSIKFIRMITKGFKDKTTLRFARMEFTRNQWRKVERVLGVLDSLDNPSSLDVNVVNIEEHSTRLPFTYVLPPGIDREENYQSAFRGTLLNEQSLDLQLCNLNAGGLRGVYKTLNMNMREYKQMKLFVHAEAEDLVDGQLSMVIRMGSDYTNNYYEYDLPLDLSELGELGNDPEVVWKPLNRIDLLLQAFKDLKLKRTTIPTTPFSEPFGEGTITVVGSPNLGDVETMFLGIRANEGVPREYCSNIWINELRLVGLNESGGAAALGRLDLQLADFGNVALSANISGIGWGSIDKQLLERSQEKIFAYDAATNLELGKFFGEKSGLKVPFFAQYSNNTSTPKYDPYDRDLTVQERVSKNPEDANEIKENAQNKTIIKTVSFNNVRKEKTGKSQVALPWDISNFSVSYTNTTTQHTDPILSQDDSKQQTGSLDYRYNTGSKPIEPFKKLIKTDKWIKFIKDINFNPLPSSISIRNVLDRKQRDRQFRVINNGFSSGGVAPVRATSRQFLWNRDYRLGWDFTKSIKFNYFATNQSAIDELDNDGFTLQSSNEDPNNRQRYDGTRKEYLWENLKGFGRNKQFDQNFDINYKLPFSKFGLLDWVTTDLRYAGSYSWTAESINNPGFGNSISNGNDGSVRVNMNFERLYNKSKLLASVNRGKSTGSKKTRNNAQLKDDKGKAGKGKKKAKQVEASGVARFFLRPLMSVRRAQFNYTEQNSSFVPGINKNTEYLGMSSGFDAPGWEYIGGFAPSDNWLLRNSNARNPEEGWFVNNDCVNQQFARTYNERWEGKLSVEPVRDFKIEINVDRNFTSSESSLFKFREDEGTFSFGDWSEYGSYTISYLTTKTLFKDGEANINQLFGTFKDNLAVVSARLNPNGTANEQYPGFKTGFGIGQQQVIVPAFIAAYRGEDASTTKLDIFKETPLPNWTLTYSGLTKIPWFKERFSRITLSHSYKSTLTVNSFNTDLRYDQDNPVGVKNVNPITGDFYSRITIPQLVITEGMSPIVKLDITTVNEMTLSFEMGKNRTLSLDPDNQQINETRGTSWTAGFGYTLKNIYLGFIPGAKKQKSRPNSRTGSNTTGSGTNSNFAGNTLKISCDFSLKDDRTIQHLWGLDVTARPTRGQRALTLSPALDYTVNEYLTMRLFFDYRSTEPYTNLSYPITNINSGLRLSFKLK